jgi:hypothetical protein
MKVKNMFGLISEVPDDYPPELLQQLELEIIRESEEKSSKKATKEQ